MLPFTQCSTFPRLLRICLLVNFSFGLSVYKNSICYHLNFSGSYFYEESNPVLILPSAIFFTFMTLAKQSTPLSSLLGLIKHVTHTHYRQKSATIGGQRSVLYVLNTRAKKTHVNKKKLLNSMEMLKGLFFSFEYPFSHQSFN